MLTPDEFAAFRAAMARRPHTGHVYLCDMVGGPLGGLRVAIPLATAEDLRHHHKTATIDFGKMFKAGYIAATYRPAGRRRLAFVGWSAPGPRNERQAVAEGRLRN